MPASSRIGLGAKWKNSEGARQVPLPNGMTLAGTQSFSPPICPLRPRFLTPEQNVDVRNHVTAFARPRVTTRKASGKLSSDF